jgi:hypothetical protein
MTTKPQRIGADDLERQVIHNINEFGWQERVATNGGFPATSGFESGERSPIQSADQRMEALQMSNRSEFDE